MSTRRTTGRLRIVDSLSFSPGETFLMIRREDLFATERLSSRDRGVVAHARVKVTRRDINILDNDYDKFNEPANSPSRRNAMSLIRFLFQTYRCLSGGFR